MNRRFVLIALAMVACLALLTLRADEQGLSVEKAREHLQAGALLVDVRTAEEYAEKNLAGAVNVPLDRLESGILNHATNKAQVLLLHCRSGRRSGLAEQQLRELGYTNAFNIGGYEQAGRIVD